MPAMKWMFAACLAACGSSPSPAPAKPAAPPPTPFAAVDAAPAPDAPSVPDEVANAPAWIFRFNAPGRLETWTLRYHGTAAMLIVEAATGTTRYLGSVTEGGSMALALSAGSARMALDCKREKLAVGAKCGDKKPKKIDVLNCYHPDFKSPMSFGPAPGVEFVSTDKCIGYRMLE